MPWFNPYKKPLSEDIIFLQLSTIIVTITVLHLNKLRLENVKYLEKGTRTYGRAEIPGYLPSMTQSSGTYWQHLHPSFAHLCPLLLFTYCHTLDLISTWICSASEITSSSISLSAHSLPHTCSWTLIGSWSHHLLIKYSYFNNLRVHGLLFSFFIKILNLCSLLTRIYTVEHCYGKNIIKPGLVAPFHTPFLNIAWKSYYSSQLISKYPRK